MIDAATTDVSGVNHGAGRAQLRYEGILIASIGGLKGAQGREVGGECLPRHVSIARRVESDAARLVKAAATEKSGVTQGGAVRAQFGHESVAETVVSGAPCRRGDVA